MDSLVSGWGGDLSWSSPHSVASPGGTRSSRIRPSLLPLATFPPLSPPLSVSAPLPPSVEPPEPEAGESRDTGVRRGLLEGAKPGGAPGYSAGGGAAAGGWGVGARKARAGEGADWDLGERPAVRLGEVNNTRACLSLCLPHCPPLHVHPASCLCLCARLTSVSLRPAPSLNPVGPLPCPARLSSRRPHQGLPGPQARTPRRSPAATCPASASACFAWRPSRTTPARPPAPSFSPRCTATGAPNRPGPRP